jgi:hypothetical protein
VRKTEAGAASEDVETLPLRPHGKVGVERQIKLSPSPGDGNDFMGIGDETSHAEELIPRARSPMAMTVTMTAHPMQMQQSYFNPVDFSFLGSIPRPVQYAHVADQFSILLERCTAYLDEFLNNKRARD